MDSQWTPFFLFIKVDDFSVAQLVCEMSEKKTAPGKNMEIVSNILGMEIRLAGENFQTRY